MSSTPNSVTVSQVSDVTTVEITTVGPQGPGFDLTLDQIKDKDCPSDKTVYTVNKAAIPTDRSFRDAWTYSE